jgi:CO/xanthine dehydrogenase FAD-binding subunit
MLSVKRVYRPDSLDEALALLRRAPRPVVLAGGTWLAGAASGDVQAEEALDISRLGLDRASVEGNRVLLGATLTLQALAEGPAGLAGVPAGAALAGAARAMAAVNLRNRATLGGSLVTADGPSPLAVALLACDAELAVQADEPRAIPLGAFLDYRARILADGALITGVWITLPSPDTRFAYRRVARTPSDYPIVCAVARCAVKDGVAGGVRAAVGGVAPAPIRLTALELGLEKKRLSEHLDRELAAAVAALRPPGDWLASAEYRREMAGVLVRRALLAAAADSASNA